MTTLWAAFGTAVHQFQPFGIQIESSPKPSGTHTARCSPPNCCIKVPIQHWTDLASRWCLDIDEHRHTLGSGHLPRVNRGVIFKSEADVVAASTLYLTHPVHSAYELVYPGDKFLRELIIPSKGKSPSSRVDMAYFAGTPSDETAPGNSNNVIALLEYKKFNGLPRGQFNSGTVSNFGGYTRAWKISHFRDRDSTARMVLKQAVHYASRFGTKFVALCDHKTLILLVMNKVEGTHGGTYALMTIVSDPKMMRKAYLGFLLAARLYQGNNSDWEKNRNDRNVFEKVERWESRRVAAAAAAAVDEDEDEDEGGEDEGEEGEGEEELQSGEPARRTTRMSTRANPMHAAQGSNESKA